MQRFDPLLAVALGVHGVELQVPEICADEVFELARASRKLPLPGGRKSAEQAVDHAALAGIVFQDPGQASAGDDGMVVQTSSSAAFAGRFCQSRTRASRSPGPRKTSSPRRKWR